MTCRCQAIVDAAHPNHPAHIPDSPTRSSIDLTLYDLGNCCLERRDRGSLLSSIAAFCTVRVDGEISVSTIVNDNGIDKV